jgi:hypothetical protein
MAENVVSIDVLDTSGVSPATWDRVAERDLLVRRRLVVIGELGSRDLEAFCAERQIPLLQLGWDLIGELTAHAGHGTTVLGGAGLAARARALPPIGYRLVRHEDCDYELRSAVTRLADIRRICRSDQKDAAPLPAIVGDAARLAGLLGRLACPLQFYEEEVPLHRLLRTAARQLDRLDRVRLDGFRGAVHRAFSAHWAMVRGSLERLARNIDDPNTCPKWWALFDRISAAEVAGEQLRILCSTRAERDALQRALVEWQLVRFDQVGTLVTVVAMRDPPLAWGGDGTTVTLLLAPPTPWQEALLGTGERHEAASKSSATRDS